MAPVFDERKFLVRWTYIAIKLARQEERLRHNENGRRAIAFLHHLKVEGLTDARLWFYASRLGSTVRYFDLKGKRLNELDRRDVEEFMSYILSRPGRSRHTPSR